MPVFRFQVVQASAARRAGYFALSTLYGRTGKAGDAFATLAGYAKVRADDRWILYELGRIAGVNGEKLDRREDALKPFLLSSSEDFQVIYTAGAHDWLGKVVEKRRRLDTARGKNFAQL